MKPLTFALVWLISIDLAHAQPKLAAFEPGAMGPSARNAHISEAVDFIVDGGGGVFHLTLHRSLITTIQFPEAITDCEAYNNQDIKVWCQPNAVKIVLHKQRPRTLPANLVVTTASFTATFVLDAGDSPSQGVAFGIVKQRADVERFDTAVTQETHRLLAQERAKLTTELRRQDALAFAANLHRRHEPITVEHTPGDDNGLRMKITGGVVVGNDLHLFYELSNHGQKPRDIAALKVFDQAAEKDLADLVYVASPGRGARERDLIAVVTPGEHTAGSVVIREVDKVAMAPLALGIMGPDGTQPVWIRDIRLAPYIEAQRQANREMLARFLHSASIVRPSAVEGDMAPDRQGAPDITLRDFEGAWLGPNDFFLRFTLENSGDRPFAWAESQALGPDRVENHAGVAEVFTTGTPVEGLIGQIPAHGRVRAGIHVERARDIEGPLTIVLSEPGGRRPIMATLRHWLPVPLQPVHDVRMWEFRPVQPPDPEKGKVSLHLRGIYGAIWLEDGAGLGKSDATSMKGLGMRAQYAFNRYIAVEGEAMGASTGNAQFTNVEYEGRQGDLARRASLGRMQFGGVLRFSEGPYVPLLRLGVGLQGASHRGTLATATGEVPGPDVGFSFDALWHFGTGLDLRLGKHFVAGFGLSAVVVAKDLAAEGISGSVEAGMHLGYAWNP